MAMQVSSVSNYGLLGQNTAPQKNQYTSKGRMYETGKDEVSFGNKVPISKMRKLAIYAPWAVSLAGLVASVFVGLHAFFTHLSTPMDPEKSWSITIMNILACCASYLGDKITKESLEAEEAKAKGKKEDINEKNSKNL